MPGPGAGNLDTRCTFQKPVKVSDGGGGETVTWTEQFTRWGGFTFPRLSVRMEATAAGAVQSAVGGELIVRDDSSTRLVTNDWRIVVTTDSSVAPKAQDVWNIRAVQPRQRDGFIRMAVEQGVPT